MTEITINIVDRKIVEIDLLKQFFNDMKDGKHMLIHKDFRKRSLPQNAYYWAVVVPYVQKGLYDAGYEEVTDNDTAHEVIKVIHLQKIISNKHDGDTHYIPGSTAKLKMPEFNDFIERVCKWSAEYLGVVIPAPSDELAMLEEWTEHQEQIAE